MFYTLFKIAPYCLSLLSILVILWYLFPIAIINGNSMHPTLKDGNKVFCRRVFKNNLTRGDIYVYYEPDGLPVIKRLCGKSFNSEGEEISYYFIGDNRLSSRDSREYGFVNRTKVFAKVINQKKYRRNENDERVKS